MKKLSFFLTLLLFVTFESFSDANQFLSDQKGYEEFEKFLNDGDEDDDINKSSAFVADQDVSEFEEKISEENEEADKFSPFLATEKGGPETLVKEVGIGSSRILPLGAMDGEKSLVTTSNVSIVNKIHNKGRRNLSFYYVKDDYEYKKNGGDLFSRTFENSTGALKGGTLHVSLDRYLLRTSYFNLAWGMNIGGGLNKGKGRFSDGQLSETTFTLWTLPLDLSLGMELDLSRYFKFSFSGGPSAMGMIQTRSDLGNGDKGKRRRQLGYGYFGEAKLKLSIGQIFRQSQVSLFGEYKMTNMFVDIVARTQSMGNFADDIEINGSSLGIGFSFEYL